jgi:hypothetical protein
MRGRRDARLTPGKKGGTTLALATFALGIVMLASFFGLVVACERL